MQAPVTVIAIGLIIVGNAILRPLRARYLEQASNKISIDSSREIVLRYVIWHYIYPLLCFMLSAFLGVSALKESGSVRLGFCLGFSLFFLIGGIFLYCRQRSGRVTILSDTLAYKEGSDNFVVRAKDVLGFESKGFTFLVELKSGQIIKIPATFEHSEIILAFLKQAIAEAR